MATPVYGTPTNVIVGVAQLFIAPAGTPMISLGTAQGAPWGSPWVASGFTETGVTFNVDVKSNMIMVEEQVTPVAVTVTSTDVTIDVTFAEDTLVSMQQAYGGGVITSKAADTTSTPTVDAYSTLTLSDSLEQVALGFEAVNAHGLWRRVYIPSVISGGKVKTDYLRAKSPRTYPATFTAICDPTLIQIFEATAAG